MARIRYIKPDFFIDPELCELSFAHRLAFAGLWCHADRAGRLIYEPKKLKIQILPYDDIDFFLILADLAKKPFIDIYEDNGKNYIQIVKWEAHQLIHYGEKESALPAPAGYQPLKKQVKNRTKTGKEVVKTTKLPILSSNSNSNSNKTTSYINTKFMRPTQSDVEIYSRESKTENAASEILKFIDYYQSKGWRVGNAPMKDWRASWRNWHRKNQGDGKAPIKREPSKHPKTCPDCFGSGFEIAQGTGQQFPCRREESMANQKASLNALISQVSHKLNAERTGQ